MAFKTMEEIFNSSIMKQMKAVSEHKHTDHVLKSTRLEKRIFKELNGEHEQLQSMEQDGSAKLCSFNSLVNDTFQSFYSLNPKFEEEENLTTTAKKLNKFILNDIMNSAEYPTMKSICEGRELPAMEATAEFTESLLPRLDELLEAASGQKDSLNVLEKLEHRRDELLQKLSELLEEHQDTTDSDIHRQIISAANKAESKAQQAEMLNTMVDRNLQKNKDKVSGILKVSLQKAMEQAEAVKGALLAWGDETGDMKNIPVNADILKKVNQSPMLRSIAKYLGKFKEMLCEKRKNSYSYGRGEKYDVTFGGSITKALTSELSLLASPELIPLFLRKYQNKKLKQYRKREAVYEGGGDIIVCLDESGSTQGEKAAWGKAVSLVLLEICRINHRNLALIHFSGQIKTDFFPADNYDRDKVLAAAETFLGGGTNFEMPLYQAMEMIERGEIVKPDIVFITDGECAISEEFQKTLADSKSKHKISITGILLDQGSHFEFSLTKFCDDIYRTSKLTGNAIVNTMMNKRIY